MYGMHVRKMTTHAGSLEFTEDTAKKKIAIDFFSCRFPLQSSDPDSIEAWHFRAV